MSKQRILRPIALFILLVSCAALASAQTGPVSYTVALDPQPSSHMLHISLQVGGVGAPSVDVAMPAWSPGAYNIHNAWRQVQEFSATDGGGAALKFEKVDKQTWRVFHGKDDRMTVSYN